MAKRRKGYLKNKDLHAEIVKSQELGELTEKAKNMLYLIAVNANRRLSYDREADRKDCVQRACYDLLKYWKKYKPQYNNALAYYTEIAKKGYAKAWNVLYPKKTRGTIRLDGSGDYEKSDGVYSLPSD